ncbi:MAG TPA: CRISPR-associated helicase Cas3', partial [Pyrinomonadaceae bacterium]
RFWAKTTDDKNDPQRENAFHPLICHLIDVAVTAKSLWDKVLPETTKKRLVQPFDLESDLERAGNLIAFLIGTHDLGKCSPPFALRGQNDSEKNQTRRLLELYRNTDCFCENFSKASDAPHGFVTSVELPAILRDKLKFPEKLAKNIAEIVGGHHGVFPTSGKLIELDRDGEKSLGGEAWRKARRELTAALAALLKVEGDFSNIPDTKLDNATAMIFAGLTTVADWIGSNADFFKCYVEDSTKDFSFDIDQYLKDSKQTAEKALKTLGWTNWVKESTEKSFDELFPKIKNKRHLQDVAIEIAKEIDSVGICVVESPMGEGKTEAAMFLADAFNARLGARGIYFALPTQATSNQMFGRFEDFLSERFKGNDLNVHLMLQHGHASISADFEKGIENFRNLQNLFDDAENSDRRGISSVVAAEWFTYKKRGLLAPFGVGTIDQILLAALQTKHVFVRLFGLAHKTIIIDEVHAYDAYMSTLLERLLEWLAALGSPVVLLSATLPKKKRDALVKAYLKGLGKAADADDLEVTGENETYPRISYATAAMPEKTFKVRHLETSAQNTKTLHLEWKDENNFVEELKDKLKSGGCAAIICNTVDKAQTLYTQLSTDEFFQGLASEDEPTLDLLHARFRFKDRDEREKRSLQRFGKPDENGESSQRPKTAVLISTQIIEQSLDLDFDLMISELAPADLLLQRAGRLHRHDRARSDNFKTPTLWLLKPETDANGDLLVTKKSLPDFGKSGAVYDKHILLRSWLKLRDCGEIKIPGDIENLIEDVYDTEKVFENLTDAENSLWRETLKIYLADCLLEENEAQTRYVKHPHFSGHLGRLLGEPKEEDAPEIHPAHQAQTRLVEPTVTVVCLWERDGKIYTDETFNEEISLDKKPYKALPKTLLFNSLSVSSKSVVFDLLREKVPQGWKESALLMRHRILKFGADRKCEMFGYVFNLDENLGLRITKKEEK